MNRRTLTTTAAAAGSAALLIGLGALGAVVIVQDREDPKEVPRVERTWEPSGGELGQVVFVEFVREISGTGFSTEQIVSDAQETCRDYAAGKPQSKMESEAKSRGTYHIAILAGSVNFYCTEYSEGTK